MAKMITNLFLFSIVALASTTNAVEQCPELSNTRVLVEDELTMHYAVRIPDDAAAVDDYGGILCVKLVSESQGWLGFAISDNDIMEGSEAVIGSLSESDPPRKYNLGSSNPFNPFPTLMSDDRQTLINATIEQNSTHTVMTFAKLLKEPGEIEIDGNGSNKFLYARGTSNSLAHHGSGKNRRDSFELVLEPDSGDTDTSPTTTPPSSFPTQSSVPTVSTDSPSSLPSQSMVPTLSQAPSTASISNVVACPELTRTKILVEDELTMHYAVRIPEDAAAADQYGGILCVELVSESQGWVGFAVSNDGKMEGSEAIIGLAGNPLSQSNPGKYNLGDSSSANPSPTLMSDDRQTLINATIEQNSTHTVMTFAKLLKEPGEIEINGNGTNTFLYARRSDNNLEYHDLGRDSFELNLALIEPPTSEAPTSAPTVSSSPTVSDSSFVNCSEYQSTFSPFAGLTMNYVVNIPDGPNSTEPGVLSAQLVYEGQGWVGFAVSNDGQMIGSEAMVGLPDEAQSQSNPGKYNLGGKETGDVTLMPQNRQTLIDATIEQTSTQTILTFTKLLDETGEITINGDGENNFLFAVGTSNTLDNHGRGGKASFRLPLAPCTSSGVPPLGAIEIDIPYKDEWKAHGILASVAWGVLTPLAIASSLLRNLFSFGKPFWLWLHMGLNLICFVLTLAAFSLAVSTYNEEDLEHFDGNHQRMGLAILILSGLQVLGGILRPHAPHAKQGTDGGAEETGEESTPKKTTVRLVWEWCHRPLGLAIVGCALWQIHRGLELFELKYDSKSYIGAFWGWVGAFFGLVALLTVYVKFVKKQPEGIHEPRVPNPEPPVSTNTEPTNAKVYKV